MLTPTYRQKRENHHYQSHFNIYIIFKFIIDCGAFNYPRVRSNFQGDHFNKIYP